MKWHSKETLSEGEKSDSFLYFKHKLKAQKKNVKFKVGNAQ